MPKASLTLPSGTVVQIEGSMEEIKALLDFYQKLPVDYAPMRDTYAASDYRSLRDAREAFEREYIGRKLREHGWNVSKTADDLRVERSHLHRKIRHLHIEIRPETEKK